MSTAIANYFKNYPEEKVYIQTDKAVYFSSQTVWFKIYTLAYGVPTALSKVAYVQLINEKGNIVLSKKLLLDHGEAAGDMQLPDSLPSNTYQLRGFTAWMLNFDESGLFHKNLFVSNFSDTLGFSRRPALVARHYRLQFFPEGGDLVQERVSNVAFKATDEYGLPVPVSGEVRDETGAFVTKLTTIHAGMGDFELRPIGQHSYFGVVKFPDSSAKEFLLPAAKPFGVVMKVDEQTPEGIIIKVTAREQEKGQFRNLVLASFQNNGKVAVYPIDLQPGVNLFEIHKNEFSSGILRLTLFDTLEEPLAERIVFIENSSRLNLELKTDTLSYKPKSRSAFSLQLNDAYWKLDKVSLSVSVTDADRIMEDTASDNIISSLLMSSELKGFVYDPAYFFRNADEHSQKALDLVMLTNGWRHFSWKQVLNNEPLSLTYPVERSLFVAGQIADYKKYTSKTQPGLKIIIHNQDNSQFIGEATPDSNGKFILNDYNAKGLSVIYYQGITHDGKEQKMQVRFFTSTLDSAKNAPFIEYPDQLSYYDLMANQNNEEGSQISNAHKVRLLKPALVRGYIPSKTETLAKKHVSSYFETSYYHDADLVNTPYPNAIRLFDFLKGRFAGLSVQGTEDNPEFYLRTNAPTSLPNKNSFNSADEPSERITPFPYFYLNEAPATFEGVKDIPLSEIALVRYIPPPAPMAPMNGGWLGVIAIYTRKSDEEVVPTKNITETYGKSIFHGYSFTREFAEPNYEKSDSLASVPDFRTTLYWNPNLVPDSTGQIHFSFYNSDHAKKYRIVIEGMDGRGRLVHFDSLIKANN